MTASLGLLPFDSGSRHRQTWPDEPKQGLWGRRFVRALRRTRSRHVTAADGPSVILAEARLARGTGGACMVTIRRRPRSHTVKAWASRIRVCSAAEHIPSPVGRSAPRSFRTGHLRGRRNHSTRGSYPRAIRDRDRKRLQGSPRSLDPADFLWRVSSGGLQKPWAGHARGCLVDPLDPHVVVSLIAKVVDILDRLGTGILERCSANAWAASHGTPERSSRATSMPRPRCVRLPKC